MHNITAQIMGKCLQAPSQTTGCRCGRLWFGPQGIGDGRICGTQFSVRVLGNGAQMVNELIADSIVRQSLGQQLYSVSVVIRGRAILLCPNWLTEQGEQQKQ